jgi:formate-dependent nitrite reductase membrane component NrfD
LWHSHFFHDEQSTRASVKVRGAQAARLLATAACRRELEKRKIVWASRLRSPENRMTNQPSSEKRLEELRDQAWKDGVVPGQGVDVAGGPIPRKPGYYGQPVVKPPVWTWEIPLYFFMGGLAGMSAVIASAAVIFHHVELARVAMWLAAIAGAILSPVLLIMDLGRPRLFLNMLRVFKHRSAMSMGAWILTLFGACAVPGLIALELHAHQIFGGPIDQLLRVAAGVLICTSAIFGTLLATYTGVLIGATAIPAWFLHRTLLPIHFGTAGLGSAAGLLELLGHRIAALNVLGFYAAAVESALLIWLSINKHGVADRAIHEHGSGWLIRIGEVLTGPLALVLRFFGLVPLAAISFLAGSLVSRFGWIWVGRVSGSDPEAVFASQS